MNKLATLLVHTILLVYVTYHVGDKGYIAALRPNYLLSFFLYIHVDIYVIIYTVMLNTKLILTIGNCKRGEIKPATVLQTVQDNPGFPGGSVGTGGLVGVGVGGLVVGGLVVGGLVVGGLVVGGLVVGGLVVGGLVVGGVGLGGVGLGGVGLGGVGLGGVGLGGGFALLLTTEITSES